MPNVNMSISRSTKKLEVAVQAIMRLLSAIQRQPERHKNKLNLLEPTVPTRNIDLERMTSPSWTETTNGSREVSRRPSTSPPPTPP